MASWFYVAGDSSLHKKRYLQKNQCTFARRLLRHAMSSPCDLPRSATEGILFCSKVHTLLATLPSDYLESTNSTGCDNSKSTVCDSALIRSHTSRRTEWLLHGHQCQFATTSALPQLCGKDYRCAAAKQLCSICLVIIATAPASL